MSTMKDLPVVMACTFAAGFAFAVEAILPDPFESIGPRPITLYECDMNAGRLMGQATATMSVAFFDKGKLKYYNQCAFGMPTNRSET